MAKSSGGEAYPIYFGAKPELLRIAGDLRHSITKAEKILWEHLRNRKLSGIKFRRQHPLNEIILDFYCHEVKLSIELEPFSRSRTSNRKILKICQDYALKQGPSRKFTTLLKKRRVKLMEN